MRDRPLILICDDDPEVLKSLQLGLRSQFEIHTAQQVPQAKALASRHDYDAAVIDLNFEGQELDGIHLLDHLSRKSPGTYLIVLSGDTSVKRVVEANRRRLFEFILKEGEFFENLILSLKRVTQLKFAREEQSIRRYVSNSPKVKDVLQKADRILRAKTDSSILIFGETGSGKEFLAQHIALNLKKPVVAANMASIPRETAESILFGHERGAFTGAISNKIGLIEAADGGIFFLDEIGECSPAIQAKLLRVLQEKEVQPVGSNKSRKVRVRFLAATHRDLDAMVAGGEFRLDLLQRLNTFVLRLPPLRERPEDILLYTDLFLAECADEGRRYSVAPDGVQCLLEYNWPGNIRELRSVIQRIVVLSNKLVLDSETVTAAIDLGKLPTARKPFEAVQESVRRDELMKALVETGGNRRLASKKLGVSQATIYRWIQDFGLGTFFYVPKNGFDAGRAT
jgi:DNA-binding NtrC family response regulator